jgi:two-component system LytT family response regulator
MRAVIVEDEPIGVKNLKNLLSKYCPHIDIVAEADGVESALKMFSLPQLQPDVAFLDINLHDGLVFQTLNELEEINFDIIFVTAHKDFAIKACDYSSIGYIVKPIDPDKLKDAVSRVRSGKTSKAKERVEVFKGHYTNQNPNAFGKMSISAVDGFYFINIRDIVRLEAEDNYTHIYTSSEQRMTVAKTIKSYEELLSSVNFFRVHKKHLINLNFMNKFMKGDSLVIMDDGMKIEVSRRRRPQFMELMKRLQVEIQEL